MSEPFQELLERINARMERDIRIKERVHLHINQGAAREREALEKVMFFKDIRDRLAERNCG